MQRTTIVFPVGTELKTFSVTLLDLVGFMGWLDSSSVPYLREVDRILWVVGREDVKIYVMEEIYTLSSLPELFYGLLDPSKSYIHHLVANLKINVHGHPVQTRSSIEDCIMDGLRSFKAKS
jgi:hypothetical protein